MTKTDGVTFYTPSTATITSKLTYTITVTNNGPLIVNAATFTDNIPAQFTGWTWSCLADTGATCNAVGSGGVDVAAPITDSVTIPAGNKVVYTVVATVSTTATGNIVNTATVQNPASIPDLVPGNNSATDTDAPPSADLAVTKTDGITYYPPGGTVTYTLDVTNNGPQAVAGATFTDVKLDPVLRPNHGFLSPAAWRASLLAAGFRDVTLVPDVDAVALRYPKFFVGAIVARL